MSVTVAPLVAAICGLREADSAFARDVARSAAPAQASCSIYADLHTSTRALRYESAPTVEPTGALFADIALMAPAPWHGAHPPALTAGSGADQYQASFAPPGTPIEVVSAQARDAAARKHTIKPGATRNAAGRLRQLANTAPRYT